MARRRVGEEEAQAEGGERGLRVPSVENGWNGSLEWYIGGVGIWGYYPYIEAPVCATERRLALNMQK